MRGEQVTKSAQQVSQRARRLARALLLGRARRLLRPLGAAGKLLMAETLLSTSYSMYLPQVLFADEGRGNAVHQWTPRGGLTMLWSRVVLYNKEILLCVMHIALSPA